MGGFGISREMWAAWTLASVATRVSLGPVDVDVPPPWVGGCDPPSSQPNATIRLLLDNARMRLHAQEPPASIAQETAQLMLRELNETTVAFQFGTYPDALAREVEERFGLMNDTAIAQIDAFGRACPRGGPGNATALLYQHILGPSEALVYLGALLTCDAIYWHLTFGAQEVMTGTAAYAKQRLVELLARWTLFDRGNSPRGLVQVDRVVVDAVSTGPISDPLALLTAVAAARFTGMMPKPPPSDVWKDLHDVPPEQ